MKKIIIIAVVIFLTSCEIENTKYEKPFIIIDITASYRGINYSNYTYQDKNGEIRNFVDNKDKYDVGDIIK